MYVLVANGYKGIIESKEVLEILSAIYPYPKFRKMNSYEEAVKFLERYDRSNYSCKINNYGETDSEKGFVSIVYVISNGDLYCTLDTSKIGYIRVRNSTSNDTVIDVRPDMVKVKISNLKLKDELISDHCIAIQIILDIIGRYVDVNIHLPDISVYLAITRYTGTSYIIRSLQDCIKERLGGISYTIERGD